MHDRKHAFFHLTGIFTAQDHLFAPLQRKINARATVHLSGQSIGRKLPGVVDHVVGLAKVLKLSRSRYDQHVLHEQGVIRPRTKHTDLESRGRVPARKPIADIQLIAGVEVVDGTLPIEQEGVLVNGMVDRPPPNLLF